MDPKSGDRALSVDLIRTVAIILVILLHAATESHPIVDIMAPDEMVRWWASNFYNSLARPCIPLFVMLGGALLLQPSKVDEPLRVFFKHRWARIGLPVIFWGVIYFSWRFFINGEPLSTVSILQGLFEGPYIHFWYIYLLIGLYLMTPVLRVVIARSSWKILKYFMLIWLVGTPLMHAFNFIRPMLNPNIFLVTGWLGYFVLGACLIRIKLRRPILYLIFVIGYLVTAFGTYLAVGTIGERVSQIFYDSFSFSVIMASIALFMLLTPVSPQSIETRRPRGNLLLHHISQNTLPIYLFHVIILETLQKGYLGFKISIVTMNPFLEIPLITFVTLIICLGVIVPAKKMLHLGRIIG